MHVLSILAFLVITFACSHRYRQSLLEIAPWLLCLVGLVCYVLAFFNRMHWIDGLLIAGGLGAAVLLLRGRGGRPALGETCRREFGDLYLWTSLLLLGVLLFCLRNEQILEWDGYNFWGPDTHSLFARDGFAPKYSNPAFQYGNYTPYVQIIWWWVTHLSGGFRERYLFWGYYLLGMLLLLSLGAQFRRRRPGNTWLAALLIPLCAFALPGVACTAWYRALVVDPIMAMLFGTVLAQIVLRPREHVLFWKAKLLTYLCALVLAKSIGALWGALAIVFFFLWWRKEHRERAFLALSAAAAAASGGSWWIYCRVMDRSGYLSSSFSGRAAQRLGELMNGTFLSAGNNKGYLLSYARAFFLTPIHKERSLAIDLSPFALLVILFAAAVLLWRLGWIPRGKLRRLLLFMAATLAVIYSMVTVGQLTMFYDETQYLDPVYVVVLMTRYCSPANVGFLMLMVAFASGTAAGAAEPRRGGDRRSLAICLVTAAILLSCTTCDEIYRRFCYDYLDQQRIEFRASYEDRFRPFAQRLQTLPLDKPGVRVLLTTQETRPNPIVHNQAAPISVAWLSLTGDTAHDLSALTGYAQAVHASYLYLYEGGEDLRQALAPCLGRPPELRTLYAFSVDEAGTVTLQALPAEP